MTLAYNLEALGNLVAVAAAEAQHDDVDPVMNQQDEEEHKQQDQDLQSASQTLSTLLNAGVEQVLASLTPQQLAQLERNVRQWKRPVTNLTTPTAVHDETHSLFQNVPPPAPVASQQWTYDMDDVSQFMDEIQKVAAVAATLREAAEPEEKQSTDYRKPATSTFSLQIAPQQQKELIQIQNDSDSVQLQRNTETDDMSTDDLNSKAVPAYMNLPASAPVVEIRNGIEYVHFTYSTKGQVQTFSMRVDIEHVSLDDMPPEFKRDNCIYPRALCPLDQYTGNRYEYEVTCNVIAWRLAWLNQTLLVGRRGLLQRAVDSYRNRTQAMRSRRVMRQQKLKTGSLRRRKQEISSSAHSLPVPAVPALAQLSTVTGTSPSQQRPPRFMSFQWQREDQSIVTTRINVEIDSVDPQLMAPAFKAAHMLFPENEQTTPYELLCNQIAQRLAYLNVTKLSGQPDALRRATETYYSRYMNGNVLASTPLLNMNISQHLTANQEQSVTGLDPVMAFVPTTTTHRPLFELDHLALSPNTTAAQQLVASMMRASKNDSFSTTTNAMKPLTLPASEVDMRAFAESLLAGALLEQVARDATFG